MVALTQSASSDPLIGCRDDRRTYASRTSAPGEEVGFAADSAVEGDGFEPSVPRTSLTPNLLPEAPATILSYLDEHQLPAMKSEPGPTISLGCAASA
jgi:hypothetical protein